MASRSCTSRSNARRIALTHTDVVPRHLLWSFGRSSTERRRIAAGVLEQYCRHGVRRSGREQVPARTVFQRRSLRLHRVRLSAYPDLWFR